MNELKVTITADSTPLVSEVNKSKEVLDGLDKTTRVLNADTASLNATHTAMANTLNSVSRNAEAFSGQSNRLVDEYKQLTSSSGAWAEAQQKTTEESARSEAALAKSAAATAEYRAKVAEAALANSASSAEITKLLDKYDAQGAKLRMLTADFNKLSAAADSGGIGGKDENRMALAYSTLQTEMKAAAATTAMSTEASAKHTLAVAGNNAALAANSVEHHVNATAMREPLVMMRELSNGNMTKFTGSLSIFAQSLGALPMLFNPVGIAIAAVTAVTVGLMYAFDQGDKSTNAMNRALVLTSNFAGQTRDGMNELAKSMADNSNLTIGEAKQVAIEVAASGKIGAGAYSEVTRLVGLYSDATGTAADASTAHIIKLFSDPAKGAIELNSTMHFLSDTEIKRIDTLQRTGDMVGAQTVLADAYTKKLNEQNNELGNLASGWIFLKKTFSDYAEAVMSWGAKSTTAQSLATAQTELAILEKKSSLYSNMIPDQVRQGEIAGHIATIAGLQKSLDDEHLKAVKDTTNAQQNQVDNASAAAVSSFEASSKQLDVAGKITQQIAYQKTLRDQEKSLSGNELADKEALLQGSIKLVASLEKQKAVKNDPVTTSYNAAIKTFTDLMVVATGKTEGLNQAQIKLLEIQASPVWAKYSEQRKSQINVDAAAAAAAEDLKKSNDDYQKALDNLNTTGQTEIDRLNKAIDAQTLLNAEIGKTPAQIELVKAANAQQAAIQAESNATLLDAAIAQMQADTAWADQNSNTIAAYQARADALHQIADEQKNLNILTQQGAVAEQTAAAVKKQAADWKALWGTVEQTGKSVFVGLLSNGQSAMAGIGKAIQASIIDMLYQVTAKQWFISVGASISGVGVAGVAQAAGAAGATGSTGGAGSWLNAGSSVYSAVSGALTYNPAATTGISGMYNSFAMSGMGQSMGLGTAATQVTAAQMAGEVGAGAPASVSSTGSALGTAGSYLGAGMAGIAVGSMIAGDKTVAGMNGTTTSALGAIAGGVIGSIVPVLGTALGAFVGGALGGIVDAAFGSGPVQNGTTTMVGNFSKTGFAGQYQTPWSQSGGWFSGDSGGINTQGIGATQSTALQATVDGTKSVFDNLIAASGEANKSLTGWTFAINQQVSTQAQQTQLMTDIAKSMGTFLIPSLAQFSKTGETLADTAVRMRDEFAITNNIANLMGKDITTAFGAVGLASMGARDNLVTLMGGIAGVNTQMQSYYQNFFTSAQQHTIQINALNAQFQQLGVTMPETRDAFKTLVNAQDLSTASGQKMFASLMAMNGAFASAVSSVNDLTAVTAVYNTVKSNLMTSYQSETAAAQALATSMNGFATSFAALQTTLAQGTLSTLSPEQKYQQAQAQFNDVSSRAKLGDPAALAQLDSVSNSFLTASQAYNASTSAYSADYAQVQQALTVSGAVASRQADIATQQVTALQNQLTALGLINTSVLSLRDALLAYRQAATAVNAAGGTATGGYTSYTSADINTYAAANNLTTPQQIYDAAVAENVDPYAVGAAYGLSKSATDAYLATNSITRVPGFATGGVASSGMYMAGENGPELIHSESATRIYPADQTSALMSRMNNSGDKEVLAAIKEAVVELRALVNQNGVIGTATVNKLAAVIDKLDTNTRAVRQAA